MTIKFDHGELSKRQTLILNINISFLGHDIFKSSHRSSDYMNPSFS